MLSLDGASLPEPSLLLSHPCLPTAPLCGHAEPCSQGRGLCLEAFVFSCLGCTLSPNIPQAAGSQPSLIHSSVARRVLSGCLGILVSPQSGVQRVTLGLSSSELPKMDCVILPASQLPGLVPGSGWACE